MCGAIGDTPRASRSARASIARVHFVRPQPAEWTPRVEITGTLEPIQAADLAFEVGGRIAQVGVALGERVTRGQTLALLEQSAAFAQRAQTTAAIGVAEAQASAAREQLARIESLARQRAAAEGEIASARQQVGLAQAQLGQALATNRATATESASRVLRAPFDGMVTRVPPAAGAVVAPGQPVVRIEDLSALRLRGTIAETELDAVAPGAVVHIDGKSTTGSLRAIVRSLDPSTRRAPVEVTIVNTGGELVGNAFARAWVASDRSLRAFSIPTSAVRTNGTVLVVGRDGVLASRSVSVREEREGRAIVADSLTAADRVVVDPTADVDDGERVEATAWTDATRVRAARTP